MLEEAIRIFAVAAVGGTARRLHVCDLIPIRAEHAQECLWSHGSGAYFDVVGLLDDRSTLGVKGLELEDQFLER